VKTDISPSFNRYRWRGEGKKDPVAFSDGGRQKGSERPLSMLDSMEANPLFGYSEHVDYTVIRKFAITDSGHMGLVPGVAQEGDVVT
jgi:hypothetical protein